MPATVGIPWLAVSELEELCVELPSDRVPGIELGTPSEDGKDTEAAPVVYVHREAVSLPGRPEVHWRNSAEPLSKVHHQGRNDGVFDGAL